MIDVLSPCVTFNDHEGSTKSYALREGSRRAAVRSRLRAVTSRTSTSSMTRARRRAVTLHNGSKIVLTKLAEDYNPTDRIARRCRCCTRPRAAASTRPACSTSSRTSRTSVDMLGIVDEPLAFLDQRRGRVPAKAALDEISGGVQVNPKGPSPKLQIPRPAFLIWRARAASTLPAQLWTTMRRGMSCDSLISLIMRNRFPSGETSKLAGSCV